VVEGLVRRMNTELGGDAGMRTPPVASRRIASRDAAFDQRGHHLTLKCLRMVLNRNQDPEGPQSWTRKATVGPRHASPAAAGPIATSPSTCRDSKRYLDASNDGHLKRRAGRLFDLVSLWALGGVPHKVALAGIDRYFERYYRKGPRRRPVAHRLL
jgi:hypothetical protein